MVGKVLIVKPTHVRQEGDESLPDRPLCGSELFWPRYAATAREATCRRCQARLDGKRPISK